MFCVAIPTWNAGSLIPPLFPLISIELAPRKAGRQEIGCAGLTTTMHVAVCALGNLRRVILSAGQISDLDHASVLIENLPGQAVVVPTIATTPTISSPRSR